MASKIEKFEAIIDHLCDELDRGNHFFQIAKALQRAYENNQLLDAPYFFAGTYDACLRESILSLAKLTIADKKSITIEYLLDTAFYTPTIFQPTTLEELSAVITQHRKHLGELRPLIESVREQRDRVIAHLDRKHINSPALILSSSVNMTELGQCFETLLRMVNLYRGYYNGSEFSFGLIESGVQDDIDYLLTLMKSAYK